MQAYQIGNRSVFAYPMQYVLVDAGGKIRGVVDRLTNGLFTVYAAQFDGTLRRVFF